MDVSSANYILYYGCNFYHLVCLVLVSCDLLVYQCIIKYPFLSYKLYTFNGMHDNLVKQFYFISVWVFWIHSGNSIHWAMINFIFDVDKYILPLDFIVWPWSFYLYIDSLCILLLNIFFHLVCPLLLLFVSFLYVHLLPWAFFIVIIYSSCEPKVWLKWYVL